MDQKIISKQNRKEMQEKVNKQYIDQKINLIIEPMAAALFTTGGGQDPIEFMLEYVRTNFGNRPSVNEGERMELEFLRSEVMKLRSEVYGNKNASPNG